MRTYISDVYQVDWHVYGGRRPVPEILSGAFNLTASTDPRAVTTIADLPRQVAARAGEEINDIAILSITRTGPSADELAAVFNVPVDDLRAEYADGRADQEKHPNEDDFELWLSRVYGRRWLDAAPGKVDTPPVTIPAPEAMERYVGHLAERAAAVAEQRAGRGLRPATADAPPGTQFYRILTLDPATMHRADLLWFAAHKQALISGLLGGTDTADRPQVFRLLDLSTMHLPDDLRAHLDKTPGVIADKREWGWFMYVPTDEVAEPGEHEDAPEVIVNIWRYAREHDCQYVLFDADADTVDDLPSFDQ